MEEANAISKETIWQRLAALEDMVAPQTRDLVYKSTSTAASAAWTAGRLLGSVAWILTTSAMVLVVPLMFEMEREQMMVQFEQEQIMQQQGAQKVFAIINDLLLTGCRCSLLDSNRNRCQSERSSDRNRVENKEILA